MGITLSDVIGFDRKTEWTHHMKRKLHEVYIASHTIESLKDFDAKEALERLKKKEEYKEWANNIEIIR